VPPAGAWFEVDKIPATLLYTFTHVEYYPKKRLDILGRFCVGFKIEYEKDDDQPEEKQPDKNPEAGLPED
jgi:hypothetical protein